MTGLGHALIGGSLSAAVTSLSGSVAPEHLIGATGLGLVAATLPDIDAEDSILQAKVFSGAQPVLTAKLVARNSFPGAVLFLLLSLAEMMGRFFLTMIFAFLKIFVGHRGLTHYLVTAVFLSWLFLVIAERTGLPLVYPVAFFVGYLSHLVADAMTISGVKLLAPYWKKTFHLLPKRWLIPTRKGMSGGETMVVAVVVAVSAVVIWLSQRG